MITSKTFLFTSLSEMSGEYTFRFTPFQGTIFFSHDLRITVYSVWGKFTLGLWVESFSLPFSKQIFVYGASTEELTGRVGFGTLYIQAKEVKADSITIRYWIDVYMPGHWYDGLTYEGTLSCITGGSAETEIIETFKDLNYQSFGLADIFDFETFVYIQATDGITTGGTRTCTIKTDSGESITITLSSTPMVIGGDAKYYRGIFFLTSGETSQSGSLLHFDSFERALVQCDVNEDSVFAMREIWASERPPPLPPGSYIKVYASSLFSIEKYEFNAEETAHVVVTDGRMSGTSKSLIVRADSGDEITVPLVEDIATRYKCSFIVTAGATDKTAYLIHLEAGERAALTCRINDDVKPLTTFIYRTGAPVETVKAYTDSGYGAEATVFDLESTIFVEATNGSETGGTKTLLVTSEAGDRIYVTLTEAALTLYRGTFKITLASTRDDNNEIHLNPNDKATLYCDVDDDGMIASIEIWADNAPVVPGSLDATHYQMQVNTQQNMLGTMMWDSQKCQLLIVVSPDDRCPEIEYQGTQLDLSGDTTYWWRIRFWVNNGTLVSPWSTEEAYFIGQGSDGPPPDPDIPPVAGADIRKPRGKAEVELVRGTWSDLAEVTAIQISNNKNPLDNIETAQGTAYFSNIGKGFYPDIKDSLFHNELFGRRIRLYLGFLDYTDTMLPIYIRRMTGIIKSIGTNRKAKTAEIVALELMDFYKTKEIKITPVWKNKSLTWVFSALVKECFPSWNNQHENADWDYWVDPLGFRRTNIYLGSGEVSGTESLPIRDCLRVPCEWVYNIIEDSEAIYDDNERRLIRGTDYEIIRETSDQGIQSWIHFLKAPYPTDENTFYAAVTVDTLISIVQYKDTTLIEELEKIVLVADCRIFADDAGRLICKSNELETTVTEDISHDTNLMDIRTRKDIDSIINHIVVESKPYALGIEVEIGQVSITFPSRASAESGAERRFYLDEFMENFRFDLTWDIEVAKIIAICTGTGERGDFELPLRDNDGIEGIELSLSGSLFCSASYGRLHIETVSIDAEQIVIKMYIVIHDTREYYNTINFHATLSCKGEGIGQPETYRGEAIDEVSYQDRYIKKQKKTFVLEYLEPGDTQARQAAYALLASLRKIRVYYDCSIRGLPHLRLMNTVALTAPDLELSGKNMQIIKISDNMQVANYISEIGLMERQIVTKVPFYWYPIEHDFIINQTSELIQTIKFAFNAEIDTFTCNHFYKLFVATSSLSEEVFTKDCYGEGEDKNFTLPFSVDILVYFRKEGQDIPIMFGNLEIMLVEATSTSLEIRYELTVQTYRNGVYIPSEEMWTWPIDWLGTLSLYVTFKRQGEIAEPGDAPPDEPHYPPDEPFTPPDDQPDDGWEYESEFPITAPYKIAWTVTGSGSVLEARIKELAAGGCNLIQMYDNYYRGTKAYRDECSRLAIKYGVQLMPFPGWAGSGSYPSQAMYTERKNDPAIWGWLNGEEPSATGQAISELKIMYAQMKNTNPDWKSFIAFGDSNWYAEGYDTSDICDVFGIDVYPCQVGINYLRGKLVGLFRGAIRNLIDTYGAEYCPVLMSWSNSVCPDCIRQQYLVHREIIDRTISGLAYYLTSGFLPEAGGSQCIWSQIQNANKTLDGYPPPGWK